MLLTSANNSPSWRHLLMRSRNTMSSSAMSGLLSSTPYMQTSTRPTSVMIQMRQLTTETTYNSHTFTSTLHTAVPLK